MKGNRAIFRRAGKVIHWLYLKYLATFSYIDKKFRSGKHKGVEKRVSHVNRAFDMQFVRVPPISLPVAQAKRKRCQIIPSIFFQERAPVNFQKNMHFQNHQGVSFRVVCFACFDLSDPNERRSVHVSVEPCLNRAC